MEMVPAMYTQLCACAHCTHICACRYVGVCVPAMHTRSCVCAHRYVGMCVQKLAKLGGGSLRLSLCAGVTIHQRCVFRRGYLGLHPKDRPHCHCCSATQSCSTLCDPMDCSTPGLPVRHQFPELAQTHVHRVGDAIQPSHPLLSPPPPAFSLSQHRVFSNELAHHIRWPKYWSFSFRICPSSSPYITTKPKPWSLGAGGHLVVSDDSRSVMFAAESFWPLCGDTWLMAGVSAPCSEDSPARGWRCQRPVGSEQPSHSRDAIDRACDHGRCSNSAAGFPAHTRPSPGAAGSRESLAAPFCGQGSRDASSQPFHLWLPE